MLNAQASTAKKKNNLHFTGTKVYREIVWIKAISSSN